MAIDELFVSNQDTDTHRMCGCCQVLRPVSEFYKDGTDNNGKTRYRRDCKWCYKSTRMQEKRMKEKRGKKG